MYVHIYVYMHAYRSVIQRKIQHKDGAGKTGQTERACAHILYLQVHDVYTYPYLFVYLHNMSVRAHVSLYTQLKVFLGHEKHAGHNVHNIGALMIRTGFWGLLYYNENKQPPK